MAVFKQTYDNRDTVLSEQALFKAYYPVIVSIVGEIHPYLDKSRDEKEVLAMASMHLGQLIRRQSRPGRREIRREIEQYLMETFGLNQPTESSDLSPDKPLGHPTHEELKGSRILIVDDSSMTRRQIQFFLKRDGFEVFEAKSGEEAIWLLNEVDPELVLMDVNMDGMDGLQACSRIKEDPANGSLPIIFLSSHGEREEIVRGFQCGAIDYLVKPFHPAESLTRIRTHLHIRKLGQLREKHIFELKQINQTKDRVLRIASHDLRNPIAAIAGLAGFLKEDTHNMTDGQREIVDCIEEAGKSVVGLLNELLDMSALDSGQAALQKEEIKVCELVRNLVPLFMGEAERKRINLTFDCQDECATVQADRQKLRRLVDNLISNAIKFTPANGAVTVRMKPQEGGLRLEVEDTGPGIPESDKHALFKEFGKTSNIPTGGEKSTGLGLSICKRIVEAHDGTIGYKNLPEGGVCFSVTLPATES